MGEIVFFLMRTGFWMTLCPEQTTETELCLEIISDVLKVISNRVYDLKKKKKKNTIVNVTRYTVKPLYKGLPENRKSLQL